MSTWAEPVVVGAMGLMLIVGGLRVPRLPEYRPRADLPAVLAMELAGLSALAWAGGTFLPGGHPPYEFMTYALLAFCFLGWAGNLVVLHRKQLAAALEDVRAGERALQQKERLATMGSLSAGVAHEINNPLQHLRTNNEMVVLVLDDLAANDHLTPIERERAARAARAIRANTEGLDHIRHIVLSLRELARPRPRDELTPDLAPAAQNVMTLAADRASLAGVELEAALQPTGSVRAPRDAVGQILLNLTLNAIEACETRGGHVRLETTQENGRAILRVADDGPGIADEIRPRLFTPFATTKPTGTGLGLSISMRIARELGGDLTYETTPGKGTAFTLTIPHAEAIP